MDNSDNDLANYFSSVDQDPSYLEHIFLPNIADYNQSRAIPKPITPENTSTENEQSSTETKRRRLTNEEESTTKPTTTVVPVEGRHTRESEQRRRERINQCFDILKNLLPTSPDVNNKKITKEGILIETIKYIESLKGEVVTMKTPSPIFNDPLTRLPLSTDEIQSGFNFLLQDTMNKFSSINSKSQLVSVQRSCTMILELADKNSYDDIKLSAYLLSALYYLVLSYNPKVMLSILDKAMPVYENLEKQKKTFTFMAADIGVTLLSMYIFALLPMGYFDLVDTYSQKLATLKKNQDNIGHFLSSNTVFIKYWKGEHVTVPEAKEIHESIVVFPSWKSYGDTIYTVSLAQTTKTHEEKMRITETINQCVIETINIFGTFIEPTVRGIAIQGYLQTDTQKSLNEIDYMLNMIEQLGITGLFPHSDYLIMKSFVLLSNNNAGTSVEEVSQKENEAEILLRYAVKVAYDNQFYISAVKALMILIKLYQKRGLQDQLLQSLSSVQQLVSLLIKRSNVPIKLLTKAQEVLNQFNL